MQQIAGDVLNHEPIVRQIGIESANQIVPILGGVRNGIVQLVAVSLGITDEIHPVPRPLLAESRRVQRGDHFLERYRRVVTEEGIDLFHRRR